LSTPKKPGTDLAALKARLAKKGKGDGAPPPIPPSSSSAPPMPPMPPTSPSSGMGSGMGMGGGTMAPPPRPAPPPPSASSDDFAPMSSAPLPPSMPASEDPFSASAGHPAFDPSAGNLDSGGDAPSSGGSYGLMGFVFVLGIAAGVGGGWIGHKISAGRELVSRGKAKGEKMVAGVKAISDARASISLAMEPLVQKMQTDPQGAAADIEGLIKDNFDSQERIDSLFGWELASVHATGVKNTFNLYDEANRLRTDLGYLGAFLATQAEALKAGGGPSSFAVEFKGESAQLVAAVEALCGDSVKDAGPCGGDGDNPIAYRVVDNVGAEPRVLPKGTGAGQGMLIGKDGGIYAYAVGMEPNKNAIILRDALLKRIAEHLEAMNKAEKSAQRALANYADNPNVDGPAPDPGPE